MTFLGTTQTITLNGSNNSVTDGLNISGGTLNATGSGNLFGLTSTSINLGAGSSGALTGNGNQVTGAAATALTLNGTGETVHDAAGDTLTLAANSSVNFFGSGTTAGSDTVDAGAGAAVTLDSGANIVAGSGLTAITLAANIGQTNIEGANDPFAAGAKDLVCVQGGGDVGTGSAGAVVNFVEGTGTLADTFNGSGATVENGTGVNLTVTGSNLVVGFNGDTGGGAGTTTTLTGTDETDYAAAHSTLDLGANTSATVNGSNDPILISSGDAVTANGADNTFTDNSGVTGGAVNATGVGLVFNLNGAAITMGSSSNATLNGVGTTLDGGAGDAVIANGANAVISVGTSGAVTDNAAGASITETSGAVSLAASIAADVYGTGLAVSGGRSPKRSWKAPPRPSFSRPSTGISTDFNTYTSLTEARWRRRCSISPPAVRRNRSSPAFPPISPNRRGTMPETTTPARRAPRPTCSPMARRSIHSFPTAPGEPRPATRKTSTTPLATSWATPTSRPAAAIWAATAMARSTAMAAMATATAAAPAAAPV
ncbi:MAG TPA: hypothetical protein VFC47_04865 [Caulobacteraceae bacterium]|nr:hypothetical protein [Caulobacteraceae bacterium]